MVSYGGISSMELMNNNRDLNLWRYMHSYAIIQEDDDDDNGDVHIVFVGCYIPVSISFTYIFILTHPCVYLTYVCIDVFVPVS